MTLIDKGETVIFNGIELKKDKTISEKRKDELWAIRRNSTFVPWDSLKNVL